jgi:UDP-2,3-diacylglucosamine hydrolase
MTPVTRHIFIADAHLRDPADENYRRMLSFLNELRGTTTTLIMMGDIFEFWAGYQHTVFAHYVPLLEALRGLKESGTRLIFVEGNHDFDPGPYFGEVLGCELIPDSGEVVLDEKRFHLTHGDLVDPHDFWYRLLRWALRSPLRRALQSIISPDWAWRIGYNWSLRSDRYHKPGFQPRDPRPLIEPYAQHQCACGSEVVVTGHFHNPCRGQVEGGEWLIVGDWISQYSYAEYSDGELSLHTFESRTPSN